MHITSNCFNHRHTHVELDSCCSFFVPVDMCFVIHAVLAAIEIP